jgi:hypothetical protein
LTRGEKKSKIGRGKRRNEKNIFFRNQYRKPGIARNPERRKKEESFHFELKRRREKEEKNLLTVPKWTNVPAF